MGTATATIRRYYGALRDGDPLAPFFHDAGSIVKFGVSEALEGPDEVAAGLREQTRLTTDWAVESRDLRVTERECHAWFADEVHLAWTAVDTGRRHTFDTRWSGTLEPHDGWAFVGMHVSAPHDL